MTGELESQPFSNYFSYFTEIEEHFQRARGTSLFLLSPLDWALIETWKNSGVPLEAVQRGIDSAFEKWRSKSRRAQRVNSIAYCAQAVLAEAQRLADRTQNPGSESQNRSAPFALNEVVQYILKNAAALRATNIQDLYAIAESLEALVAEGAAQSVLNLEALETRLTVLEQRLIAIAKSRESEEKALSTRQELEKYLRPWRRSMSASQLAMLEAQFIDRAVLESAGLPRLSMFYLTQ